MKIKKNMQDHIDVLNRELKSFADRNSSVVFSEVINTDEDYTQGSLKFENFTVLFRCHGGGSGYSFMEVPMFEYTKSAPMGCVEATYEALFKFDFSLIPFSIYDIHNAINDQNFRTLCFHNIITEENAVDAISEILDFISKNEYQINQIGTDDRLQKTLLENYYHDEKVFDKKFDINKFNEDIETNAEMHEVLMGITLTIQDGVYKFLLTGNNKQLVKEFNKAEKKNDLILFERRYEKYLYDHNFQKPDSKQIKELERNQSNSTITKFFNTATLVLSFVIGVLLSDFIEKILVDTLYKNDIFLGYTSLGILNLIFVIGIVLLTFGIAYKLPFKFVKNKVSRMFKKEYEKPLIIAGLVLVVIGAICITNTFKNHGIFIRNDVLYIENQTVNENLDIEFIFIKGYEEADENGKIIYYDDIEDRELLYVFDGLYEEYQYCVIYSEDYIVTNQVLNKLKKADCKLSSYRTLEEFAEKNGFELEEE